MHQHSILNVPPNAPSPRPNRPQLTRPPPTPFGGPGGINALCWPRTLPGDFAEIGAALSLDPGITTLDDASLTSLSLSPAGSLARDALLTDQKLLRAADLSPVLDGILGYTTKEKKTAPPRRAF